MNHILPFDEFEFVPLENADLTESTENASVLPEEKVSSYEVKLLLDSDKTLGEDHRLKEEIRQAFHMKEMPNSYLVAYMETPDKDFLSVGWINRVRARTGHEKIRLTYKKRFPIQNGDIDAALSAAAAEGLTKDDAQFPTEIDWGYEKMTLSFSHNVDLSEETAANELPEKHAAMDMIAANMPAIENAGTICADCSDRSTGSEAEANGPAADPAGERQEWGIETLQKAQMVGPVSFLRYTGKMKNGVFAHIEIWPVEDGTQTQYIVEISAKFKRFADAERMRRKAISRLDKMGILLHTDALKTQMILNGPTL